MRIDSVAGKQYLIVDRPGDLLGWNILHVEHFKRGVKRLHVMHVEIREFRMLYCPTEYLEGYDPLEAEVIVEDVLDVDVIG